MNIPKKLIKELKDDGLMVDVGKLLSKNLAKKDSLFHPKDIKGLREMLDNGDKILYFHDDPNDVKVTKMERTSLIWRVTLITKDYIWMERGGESKGKYYSRSMRVDFNDDSKKIRVLDYDETLGYLKYDLKFIDVEKEILELEKLSKKKLMGRILEMKSYAKELAEMHMKLVEGLEKQKKLKSKKAKK